MRSKIVKENDISYRVEIDDDGAIFYFKKGTSILHREDGPAVEHADGDKFWYKEGLRHRLDGPAAEYYNGNKFWLKEGKYHRENGPACEFYDGTKAFYLNDILLENIKTDEELIIKLLLE